MKLGPYMLPPDKMLCIKFVIRIPVEQMMSFLQYGMGVWVHVCVCVCARACTQAHMLFFLELAL